MHTTPLHTLPLVHLKRPDSGQNRLPPALFLLHGYGSDEADLFSFASELPPDLFVISLRAPYTLQPFGYAWYAIDFNAPQGKWNDTSQAIESRELVRRTIDEAIALYSLDPERISLLGFSQGTILSYAIAFSYPHRFKSLIALSGYADTEMFSDNYRSEDLSGLQIYASHGDSDMVIPVSWARQTSEFLRAHDVSHIFELFPTGHGVSRENLQSFLAWMRGKY